MMSGFFLFIVGLQIVPFGMLYRFTCPQSPHWKIVSKTMCPHATNYTCLLDILTLEYRQNCKGPKRIAPGSKYVWQPNFNRGECDTEKYQPFIFHTDGYTNCSFLKSRCCSEGQATFSNGSAKMDRSCYCDTTKGYVFVRSTRHDKYCEPSKEDCSCHENVTERIIKTYKTGLHNVNYTTNRQSVQSEVIHNVKSVRYYDDHKYNIRRNEYENARNNAALVVLVMLVLMLIISYPSAVLFVKIWPRFRITLFMLMQHFNRSARNTIMVNRDEEETLEKIISHQNMLTVFERSEVIHNVKSVRDYDNQYDEQMYNIRRNEYENARNNAACFVLGMLIMMLIIPYDYNRLAENTIIVNRDEKKIKMESRTRKNMLTGTQKCVLLRYMSTLSNIEIIEFALLLLEKGFIKQCAYSCIESCYKDINNPNMRSVVVKNVLKMRADLRNVVFVMYNVDNKHKSCAIQLFTYFKKILEVRPVAVSKVDTQDRTFIQAYFNAMQQCVQKKEYENTVDYLTNLSYQIQKTGQRCNQTQQRIFTEICDKYIVLVALTFYDLAHKAIDIDPNDNLFNEIEAIISKSSCPDLSRCMLYGSKAVALSSQNKQEEGEDMAKMALICAANVVSCLETVDMFYKLVFIHRAWYEKNQQKKLLFIAEVIQKAFDILKAMEDKHDEERLFWSRRFAVRLLFCYLGLGMNCRFIHDYQISPEHVQKSEKLLELFDSSADIRTQMFFYIAYARLFHLTGDIKTAILYNDKAKKMAEKGYYRELRAIHDNELILRAKSWSLPSDLLQNPSFV